MVGCWLPLSPVGLAEELAVRGKGFTIDSNDHRLERTSPMSSFQEMDPLACPTTSLHNNGSWLET
jgi:hypothetical protein